MKQAYLERLMVFRPILEDEAIKLLSSFLDDPDDESSEYELVSKLIGHAETLGLSGNILQGYILYRMANDENIASRTIELENGEAGSGLMRAMERDMETLAPLLGRRPGEIFSTDILDDYHPTREKKTRAAAFLLAHLGRAWTPESLAKKFVDYYRRYGCGDISSYRAFRWADSRLVGIRHFEPILLTSLIGYAEQKKELTANTLAFLGGLPANNVLLVGARGTGKSSSVKALANEYFSDGLRLLQITKPQLADLPEIMTALRAFSTKRFIVFLDDLSFEDSEVEYKYLKSAIEGGVESRPDNVLIYATSNRRHLVREKWSDRENGQDEVRASDSMNETLSLSDRFGLVINYRAPNQNEYLAIIDHYLRAGGVILQPEELRVLGKRWELEHSGRSGRTARQFVDHYLGRLSSHRVEAPDINEAVPL